MQSVSSFNGSASTRAFPLKGTLDEFRKDLAALGFPVDQQTCEEIDEVVAISTFGATDLNGGGEVGSVCVSALLEHEEQGQEIEKEPRDLLDVIARHVQDGYVVVLDESALRGHTARRWAVDAKGGRVSIDLVDIEDQIVEHLDCAAGIPRLD